MSENTTYEGPVNVFTTDRDGNPLTIKSGKRAGSPWAKISFKVDGEWINLPDFSGKAAEIPSGTVCKVAYAPDLDEFGEPRMYNDRPQFRLMAIKPSEPVAGTKAAAPVAAPANGAREKLSAMQTALNCAASLVGAMTEANATTGDVTDAVLEMAETFHAALLAGTFQSLDVALAKEPKAEEKPVEGEAEEDFPF